MKLEDLQRHVISLCQKMGINYQWTDDPHQSGSWAYEHNIVIPRIINAGNYYIALHEIGHVAVEQSFFPNLPTFQNFCQSASEKSKLQYHLKNEFAASEWAKKNALEWNDEMENAMRTGLASHVLGTIFSSRGAL